MKSKRFEKFDKRIISFLNKYGINLLRYSLAIIFIWFGILKPLGVSSAIPLVKATVFWFDPSWFVPFLGWWEILIGVLFLIKPLWRISIALLGIHIAGTFLPLVILPSVTWQSFLVPTIEGQYIIKNLVIVAAAFVIGAHVRDR